MTYMIHEEQLGPNATREDAEELVELIRSSGYDVAYGQSSELQQEDAIPQDVWDEHLNKMQSTSTEPDRSALRAELLREAYVHLKYLKAYAPSQRSYKVIDGWVRRYEEHVAGEDASVGLEDASSLRGWVIVENRIGGPSVFWASERGLCAHPNGVPVFPWDYVRKYRVRKMRPADLEATDE